MDLTMMAIYSFAIAMVLALFGFTRLGGPVRVVARALFAVFLIASLVLIILALLGFTLAT